MVAINKHLINKNIEYRTRNFEFRRMESLCSIFFYNKKTEFLTSTFIIPYSTFDIHFFQVDL